MGNTIVDESALWISGIKNIGLQVQFPYICIKCKYFWKAQNTIFVVPNLAWTSQICQLFQQFCDHGQFPTLWTVESTDLLLRRKNKKKHWQREYRLFSIYFYVFRLSPQLSHLYNETSVITFVQSITITSPLLERFYVTWMLLFEHLSHIIYSA